MTTSDKPIIGKLYSPREQYEMHGGNMQRCAPDKDGRVLLLRVNPRSNPDAPRIIDWEAPNDPWVRTIQEQDGTLPLYIFRRVNAWEYMGQFRVAHVATDAQTLSQRSRAVGQTVSYAIYLERMVSFEEEE